MNRSSIYRPGPHPERVPPPAFALCEVNAGAGRIHVLLRHTDGNGRVLAYIASASGSTRRSRYQFTAPRIPEVWDGDHTLPTELA